MAEAVCSGLAWDGFLWGGLVLNRGRMRLCVFDPTPKHLTRASSIRGGSYFNSVPLFADKAHNDFWCLPRSICCDGLLVADMGTNSGSRGQHVVMVATRPELG